ncbi:MAG: beta-glucosidase, partial [Tepidisphaeraceae bacterium]
GYQGDPKLTAVGLGGTIGNADNLKNLTAYKLQGTSPLINKGVVQPTFLAAATLDFYGDTLPKGGKYDIGIDEVA